MNTSLFLLPLALCVTLVSCEKYSLTRYYRSQVMEDGHTLSPSKENRDTTVYVSAVIVPEDYDWRRDTAYGTVDCSLAFFQNGECVFSIPAGRGSDVSVNPSTHHIIDGHLYSECPSGGKTIITADGEVVLRYEGEEALRGLLVRPGETFTLGKTLGADGFCLRRNGEAVLRQASGSVYGGFLDPSCGETGALYEDEGQVCFCFRDSRNCYKVVDGVVSQVRTGASASSVVDMKIVNSGMYYITHYSRATMVYNPSRTFSLQAGVEYTDLKIADMEDAVRLIVDAAGPERTIVKDVGQGAEPLHDIVFDGVGNCIYRKDGPYFAVSNPDGLLRIQREEEGDIFLRDSSYFFGRACATAEGEGVYLAVNPKERDCLPFVWHSGEEKVFDFNGFLTGVAVKVVNPPN